MTKRLNLVKAGFIRRKDWDFTDDGSRFTCYEYDGLRISVCKYNDEYFVSVRIDYMDNSFTYKDWMATEEYKLADEFNGCYDVNVEKLVYNCDRILVKIHELNEIAKNEVINTEEIVEELTKECVIGEKAIAFAKENFSWWKVSDYEVRDIREAINSINAYINHLNKLINKIEDNTIEISSLRQMSQFIHDNKFFKISEDGYFIKKLLEVK